MDADFQDISRELLIKTDSTRTITKISSNCYHILGYNRSEIIGSKIDNYFVEDIGLMSGEAYKNIELTLKKIDGEEITCDAVVCSAINCGVKISLFNINKYKEIELWEKRFRSMLENTKDMVYLYDIIPEPKFIYINKAVEDSLGTPPSVAYADAMQPFHIAHPDELHIQYEKISKTTDFSKPLRSRMKNSKGEYIWFEDNVIPFYNDNGDLKAISGFCRNIQDRKELEQKLEELSYHDSLTGLFSNNYYNIQEKRLNDTKDNSIGIVMCDLDNLKVVNDTYGHAFGDKLLINFANLLKSEFGKSTILVRKGGDEFILLIENTSEDNVATIYSEVHQALDNYNNDNPLLPIKASIGWGYSPTSLGVVEKVFRRADEMMYENKLEKRRHSD